MTLALIALFAFQGQEVRVSDLGSLRAAVVQAKPGTRILIAPGDYAGGVYTIGLHGTARAPIIICAADPSRAPKFSGAFQFQDVSYLEIRDLTITGVSGNAIGIDDGGIREKPANHVTLSGLHIFDSPGDGTNGIKLAGLDDFQVVNCVVQRWGGCAVDMVGCHRGLIEGCHFEKGGGLGVQAKGASSDVTIRKCAFVDYGGRGVNLGGSTGTPFYRPAIEGIPAGARFESKNIIVEGCTFSGGLAPVAFVGADGGIVRFNTIFNPGSWAMRILQETNTPDFAPSHGGRFEDNIVVFRSDHWFEGGVNIGPDTAPKTFRFARNWWFCSDKPERSRPNLPAKETDGVIGRDPMIQEQDLTLKAGSPAGKVGAQAFASPEH